MKILQSQLLKSGGLLLFGLLLGYLYFGGSSSADVQPANGEATAEAADAEEGETIWVSPMHPWIQSDEPGQCPICGMDLVPMDASDVDQDAYALTMSESAVHLAQVQTQAVRNGTPTRDVALTGRIEVDERQLTNVTSHFPGRVRSLHVNYTGATIQRGQPMASIYSPELVSAQRELLEALRHEERNPRMADAAREKLRQWELTDAQIRQIEERGEVQTELDIVSPVSGVILARNVAREDHVREGEVLFEVANLNRLWVIFDAHEDDVNWLRRGDRVAFTPRAEPGQEYTASINYIEPTMDAGSRTVRVRAEISNPGNLKPDMLVRGTAFSNGGDEGLMVPASAVLWTGPRSIVYVQDTSSDVPRFESREVTLGPRAGDEYLISDGLMEGEHVVTNGAFMIDSEFQLANRMSMMNRPEDLPIHRAGMAMDATADRSEPVEDVPEAFRTQLTEAVDAYLNVKEALYVSDLDAAQEQFGTLERRIEQVNMRQLEGELHDAWMEELGVINSAIDQAQTAGDLDDARLAFHQASEALAASARQFGLDDVIYHQYCPMAFGDESGTWLSRSEEIRNPYLAENMPECGEVIEQIGA